MQACLNPNERHRVSLQSKQDLLCTEPGCGFFIEGAMAGPWQVKTLLRHTWAADLYLATSGSATTTNPARGVVKVLKGCAPGSYMRLERVQKNLQHPFIHPIYSAGWIGQEQVIYLVSRFEERGSLAQYLRSEANLSLTTICTFVSTIATALHYAHNQHLVHGHVKPENCLLVSPDSLQVCDFYSTLLLRNISPTPSLYLAPEQLQSTFLPASDQYALAVIACQFLSVSVAQRAPAPRRLLAIDDVLVALPQRVQQILRQALHSNPSLRFPTVSDFALEFQKAISQVNYRSPARTSQALPPLFHYPGPPPVAPLQALPEPPRKQNAEIPNLQRALTLCKLPGHTAPVTLVRWSVDGVHLASASSDQKIRIWYIQQRIGTPRMTLSSEEGGVTALSWSPGGQYLASATENRAIYLWSPTVGPGLQEPVVSWWGHDGAVTALDWSPDGFYLVSGGKDHMVHLWDTQGNLLSSWQAHGRGGVSALAWSPDGMHIASGGSDREVSVWDASRGKQVGSIALPRDEVRRLCWNPDGRFLAACAGKKDTAVYLWDTKTGQQIAPLVGHQREVVGLFWSAEKTRLVTASADSTLRCWDLTQFPVMHSQSISLDEVPLSMDGIGAKNLIALGTASMRVVVLQLI
jgi:eukaryotic-like serine/threonine-protein kinase